MKRFLLTILAGLVSVTLAALPRTVTAAEGKAGERSVTAAVQPQLAVVCTGWHALCSASTDCRANGVTADCDCLRVDEPHIVVTSEIQDPVVRRMTQTRCTTRNSCDVDEAPVCGAIRDGRYEVNQVRYRWVSTYSYRGWCGLYRPKACDTTQPGYDGDMSWAVCDGAPCTESDAPFDPERPLRCECRVMEGPFVGTKGSCTGERGGIISALALEYWDFENDTYSVPVPGYDYVRAACAALESDPRPAASD